MPSTLQGIFYMLRKDDFMAQPFDSKQVKSTGDAFPVAEADVRLADKTVVCASQNGILAYQSVPQVVNSKLVWFDRTGKTVGAFEPAQYFNPRISPDGKKVAISVGVPGKSAIWISDASGQARTRLTFASKDSWCPVWSPDGNRIVFASIANKFADVYAKSVSGAGSEQLFCQTEFDKSPSDWSKDGKFIAFQRWDPVAKTNQDIWILSLTGDRKPFPFLRDETNLEARRKGIVLRVYKRSSHGS